MYMYMYNIYKFRKIKTIEMEYNSVVGSMHVSM
jgi:hypothetical protein